MAGMDAGGGKKTAMFMASGLCWMPEKGAGEQDRHGKEASEGEEGSRGRSSHSESERSETYVSSSMQSEGENEDGSRSWSDAGVPRRGAANGREPEPEYDSLRALGGSSHNLASVGHPRQPQGPNGAPHKPTPMPAEDPPQIHLGLSAAAPADGRSAEAPALGASTKLGATDSGHSSSSSTGQELALKPAQASGILNVDQIQTAAHAAGEQFPKCQQQQSQQGEQEEGEQRKEQGLQPQGSLPRQQEEAAAAGMAAPSLAGNVLSPTAAASRVCSAASPAPFLRGQMPVPAPAQPSQNLPCPAPLLLLPSPSLPTLPSDLLSAVATLPLCGVGSEGQKAVEKTGSCTQSAADEALDTTLSLSLGPPVAKGEGEGKGTPQTSNFSVAAPLVEALELAAPAEELSEDTGGTAPTKRSLSDAKLPGWLGAHQPAPSGGGFYTDKSGSPSLEGGSAQGGELEFTLALAGGISDNSSSGSHLGLHHTAHHPPNPHQQQSLGLHLQRTQHQDPQHPQQQTQLPRGLLGPAPQQSILGVASKAEAQQPQQQKRQGVPATWDVARHEESPTAAWVAAAPRDETTGRQTQQPPQPPATHPGPWQAPGAPSEGPLLKALQPGPRKLMGVPLSATSSAQGPIKLLHIGAIGSHRPEGPKGENVPPPPQGLMSHQQAAPGQHAQPRAGMGVYPQLQAPLRQQQQQTPSQPGMLPHQGPAPSHQPTPQGMPGHRQAPFWAQNGKAPEMGPAPGTQAAPHWQGQQQQQQLQPQHPHQAQQQALHGPQQLTPPPPGPPQLSPHSSQPQVPYSAPPNHLHAPPHHQAQQQWHRGSQQPQQHMSGYPYQQPLGQYPQQHHQQQQQSVPHTGQAWQGPGQSHMAPGAPPQGPPPSQRPWLQEAPLHMPPPHSQHPQQPSQHLGAPPHAGQASGPLWNTPGAPRPQQPQQYGHPHHSHQQQHQHQQGPLKAPAQHQYLPQQQQQGPGHQYHMQAHHAPLTTLGHQPQGPSSMQPGAPPPHQQARQYLGIRLEGGVWFADLEYSNKRITLGYRCTAQEAAQLYDRAAYVLKGRDSQLNLPLALDERAELEQHSETSFLAKLAEENHLLWGGQPIENSAAAQGHFPNTTTASSSCLDNPGQKQQQQQTVSVGAMASDGSAERVSQAGGASNSGKSRKRPHNGQGSSSSGGAGGSQGGSGAPPGVRWVQSANKWLAYIRLNGSSLTLGYRKKMADAAKLHERAKYKLSEDGEAAGLTLSAEERRELDAMSKKEFLAWVEVENARQRGYSSLFTGVSWSNMTKKWEAYIRVKGRQQYLGLFSCETDAALSYDKALLLRDGPNANTNAKRFPTIFDGLVTTAEASGADAEGSKAGAGASKEDASEVTHSAVESKEGAKGDTSEGQQKRQKQSKGASAGQRSKQASGGLEDGPEPSLSSMKLKDLQRSSSLSTGVRPSGEDGTQQHSQVTASTASGDDARPRKKGAAQETKKLAAAKSDAAGGATSSGVTQAGKGVKKGGAGQGRKEAGKGEEEASLWEASRDLLMLRDRKIVPGLEEGAGDTKDAEVEEGEVREDQGPEEGGEAMSPVERKPDTPLAAWAPVGSSGKKVGQPQRSPDYLKKKGKKLLFGSAALAAGPRAEGLSLAPPSAQGTPPGATLGTPGGTPPTKEAAMLLLLPAKRAAEDAIQRQKSSVEEEDEDEGGTLSQLIPNCLPRVASTSYSLKPHSLLSGSNSSIAEGEAGAPLWAKKRRQ